ncbi:hypothetical protein Syun_011823 [Stephania yunnanensis]|uniref:Uncharacterized protein n=1 Tax=Stephania yunnanensis TaxID=152371 RepID=A0AAP0JY92_9MAGN
MDGQIQTTPSTTTTKTTKTMLKTTMEDRATCLIGDIHGHKSKLQTLSVQSRILNRPICISIGSDNLLGRLLRPRPRHEKRHRFPAQSPHQVPKPDPCYAGTTTSLSRHSSAFFRRRVMGPSLGRLGGNLSTMKKEKGGLREMGMRECISKGGDGRV